MKNISTLMAVAMLTIGGSARADIWSAGPAYPGNPTNGFVTCRIFNAGNVAANITTRSIFSNASTTPISLATDTCSSAVPPLGYCGFTIDYSAVQNLAFSCRITTAATKISGAIEVRTTTGVSAILPLHP
jgi:hypothetical protein